MSQLIRRHCQPIPKGTPALEPNEVSELIGSLHGWNNLDNTAIERAFSFKNFYETIAFVNAVAWIANREDHHPDLQVGYNRCVVRFNTHSVRGLSENDFICAAKVDSLQS